MHDDWRGVRRTYLILLSLHTLAASLIWGINTLFLLDAGLTNTQAFAANAFFTAGFVLFEIPTGVIADRRGRRLSYLLGTATLAVTTLAYLLMWRMHAPFWGWAISSALLGLGFTFFSGAVQAWLVDALHATGFDGNLESVFAKGEIVEGVAMLGGSVAGGLLAQFTNLGVPYIVRACVLALTFFLALLWMRDLGFKPQEQKSSKTVLREAFRYGLANPQVRWVMLANFFTDGVSIFAFYAMQPYLLLLYGNPDSYWVAGLAAAIVGGAQIGGGALVTRVSKMVRRRTTVLLAAVVASTASLAAIGLLPSFWFAIGLFVVWGLVFAMVMPVRQAYINALIPSEQRATVLSFDSLTGSVGGVFAQPLLGRAADVWSYPASYLCSAAVQVCAIPFMLLARRAASEKADRTSSEK